MSAMLRAVGARLEMTLAGHLPTTVRKNMMIELGVAIAYGIFYAMTLPFIPVLLRRSGATAEMVALYTAQQFIGSVLTAFSIVLMRRRRTMNIIALLSQQQLRLGSGTQGKALQQQQCQHCQQ